MLSTWCALLHFMSPRPHVGQVPSAPSLQDTEAEATFQATRGRHTAGVEGARVPGCRQGPLGQVFPGKP